MSTFSQTSGPPLLACSYHPLSSLLTPKWNSRVLHCGKTSSWEETEQTFRFHLSHNMWSPSGPRIVSSPRRFLCPLANANYLAPASHFCRADVGPLWSLFLTPKSSLELKIPVHRWYSPHWQFMKKECKMSSMIKALHWSPQERTSVAVFPAIKKRFFFTCENGHPQLAL